MRAGGEVWEAVSSRIVLARLKLVHTGKRRPGGSRETSDTFVTVLSVYAPTAKAPLHVKQQFIEDLQDAIDQIPTSDVLVLLGDFNARVGRRDPENDLWRGTLGVHGLDERNDAGEEFLEFCATNQLTIMNSWFQKKEIHLGTWMHPATKKHHMIDFVIMRASQKMLCMDVRVMKGANCWSDHRMVRARLRIKTNSSGKSEGSSSIPYATYLLCSPSFKDAYREIKLSVLIRDYS